MTYDDRGYARRLIRTARDVADPAWENNIAHLVWNLADALEEVLAVIAKAEGEE